MSAYTDAAAALITLHNQELAAAEQSADVAADGLEIPSVLDLGS